MKPDYWNRQIEIWMDVFSDDNPDLMALEIVREFDNLIKKFYCINGRTSCGAIMAMTIATHFSINRLTLIARVSNSTAWYR